MIEITNQTKGPIQLVVKSLSKNRKGKAITVLNIPGVGGGQNVRLIEDERHTDYIDWAEQKGFIKQKKISNPKAV